MERAITTLLVLVALIGIVWLINSPGPEYSPDGRVRESAEQQGL